MTQTHVQKVRLLYKTVLKLHKALPTELKELGDLYAKEEFKRHKECSLAEAQVFMSSWADYAINLAQQLGVRGKPKGKLGMPVDERLIANMSEEQVVQMYELLKASKGLEESKDLNKPEHDKT